MIINREEIKKQFDGKSDEEALKILDEEYNIFWSSRQTSCKFWFAEVFTYCSSNQLEDKLKDFLWFINTIVVPFTKSCFNEEDTVFLGCVCPCGNKQTILYYTLTPNN